MCSSSRARCSTCDGRPSAVAWSWRALTCAEVAARWASSWSICWRWAMYSRTGQARLSATPHTTPASRAPRPVSRVAREAAASAAACAGVWFPPTSGGGEPRECRRARVGGRVAQVLFDAQQLVVLGDPLAAGRGAGLDLPGVSRHRQGGAEGVIGLAGPVADHAGEAGPLREADRVQGLGDGADLVDLDQQGVGCLLRDTAAQPLRVGDET